MSGSDVNNPDNPNTPVSATTAPGYVGTYTIKRGDTLWGISRSYGITVDQLRAANNFTTATRIFPGMVLNIPAPAPTYPTPPPVAPIYHKVAQGETLQRIATQYGLTTQAITAANPHIAYLPTLPSGLVILLPLTPPTDLYVVQQGDNLAGVAVMYAITLDAAAAYNKLTPPYKIVPGQSLRVPPGGPKRPNPNQPPPTNPTPNPFPPTGNYQNYTVPPSGEPFFAIALRFNITQEALALANNLRPPYSTYPGQVLRIPLPGTTPVGPTGAIGGGTTGAPINPVQPQQPTQPQQPQQTQPSGPRTHTVQQGENIVGIALRYGSTIEAFAAKNNLTPPYAVTPGQVLYVP